MTDVVPVTAAAAPSTTDLSSQSAHPASKGFFANHGAVAGVFSVAGVLALILAVVLLTNAVRRRRARKFDAEIEAAAREAAHADIHLPNDDDDEFNFGARSVYTDHTHGTYSQAPLKAAEAYTMAELPAMGDPYGAAGVGSGYAGAGVGAGGAGMAGVGGGNLNRSRSTTQPYNAFAGPQVHAATTGYNPDPYAQPTTNAQMGLLEAAGVAGTQANLARAPSGAASRLVGGAPSASPSSSPDDEHAHDPYAPTAYAYPPQAQPQRQPQQSSYAQQQQSTYQQQQQSQEQYGQVSYGRAQYHAQQARPVSMAEDPYAGYAAAETFAAAPTATTTTTTTQHQQTTTYQQAHAYEHEDAAAPAYYHEEHYVEEHEDAYEEHEAYGRGHAQHDDVRASVDDLDDYGYGGGRRVLKVRSSFGVGWGCG